MSLGSMRMASVSPKSALFLVCCLLLTTNPTAEEQQGESVQHVLDRATAAFNRGDFEAAANFYEALLEALPDNGLLWFNAGLAYSRLNDLQNSKRSFEKCIQVLPSYANAYASLGSLYSNIGNHVAAYDIYSKGLEQDANNVDLLYNIGLVCFHLRRLPESAQFYRRLIEVDPSHFRGLNNLGVSLMTAEKFSEAIDAFLTAYQLRDHPLTFFNYMMCKNRIANWTDFEGASAQVASIMAKHPDDVGVSPFNCLEFQRLPIDQCPKQSRAYGLELVKALTGVKPIWNSQSRARLMREYRLRKGERLNIGYLHTTGFVETTTTARMLQSVFRHHDRSKYHVHCFALSAQDHSPTRARIAEDCETFIDLSTTAVDMAEVARQVAKYKIHVLIDLSGYTIHPRTGVFYLRPAPVQVNFHGYPGTLAMDFIDYVIVDQHTAPPEADFLYTEKLVYLPHTYLVNSKQDRYPEMLQPVPSSIHHKDHGLPEGKFIYASFHQFYKITPDLFDTWMRILTRVPGSVLWMIVFSPEGVGHLKHEAELRGVDPSRLVFTPRIPRESEYQVKRLAHVFLDTPVFNGHSTATDVLWCGLPMVTRPGSLSFQARVATGLVNALGVRELSVTTDKEYEDLAVRFGTDPDFYKDVRAKVEGNRATAPLFDTERWTRNFEASLDSMWEVFELSADNKPARTAHHILPDVRDNGIAGGEED